MDADDLLNGEEWDSFAKPKVAAYSMARDTSVDHERDSVRVRGLLMLMLVFVY